MACVVKKKNDLSNKKSLVFQRTLRLNNGELENYIKWNDRGECARNIIFETHYNVVESSRKKTPYQEHHQSEWDFVPPPRGVVFSWCSIRNIGQLFLLVHEIYLLKYYSQNICIRSTTLRRAISCHLFECHVLLLRNTKFQSCDKISWTTSVSGARHIGGRFRATSWSVTFPWYRIRNMSHLFLLVHEIYLSKYYSRNICIRSSIHRRAISCHLFECHVPLLPNTKYRPAIPSRSRDIHVKELLEERLYQEHHPSDCDLVPPLRVSCSLDTKYEISTWYSSVKISWTTCVSGESPIGGRCRASSLSDIFS